MRASHRVKSQHAIFWEKPKRCCERADLFRLANVYCDGKDYPVDCVELKLHSGSFYPMTMVGIQVTIPGI